jgi:hypothetical protein
MTMLGVIVGFTMAYGKSETTFFRFSNEVIFITGPIVLFQWSMLRLSTPRAALWIPIKLFSEILDLVAGTFRFGGMCLGLVGSIFGVVRGLAQKQIAYS